MSNENKKAAIAAYKKHQDRRRYLCGSLPATWPGLDRSVVQPRHHPEPHLVLAAPWQPSTATCNSAWATHGANNFAFESLEQFEDEECPIRPDTRLRNAGTPLASDASMDRRYRCFIAGTWPSPLCRDHLFHQPPETPDIAGRIDGVTEANDHQALRRHDHDSLAEIAGCKKRIARNSEPDAAFGVLVLAAIGPEAGAVIGIERGRGREIHPVLVQDPSDRRSRRH